MLVILAHATVPSDPREGAFDNPGQTHNLEYRFTAFDDAKLIALGFDEPCELAALVTGIRNDRFDSLERLGPDHRARLRLRADLTCWRLRLGWQSECLAYRPGYVVFFP